MVNIVTSICVDTDNLGQNVNYPQLSGMVDKRAIYWQLVTVFCYTSIKVNPEQRHLIYTNDPNEVSIKGVNIRAFLEKKGVQIIYLPFKTFDPADHSNSFRNAFYKLEVVKALGNEQLPSILLDSDCIWSQPADKLVAMLEEGKKLLLVDTYQRNHEPQSKTIHNLSMEDMGNLYTQIDSNYAVKHPVWYGGEVIGGSAATLKKVAEDMEALFSKVKQDLDAGKEYRFSSGKSIMDNDEFVSSFVLNQPGYDVFDLHNKYLRRMWTSEHYTDITPTDRHLAIWHMPAEKEFGLRLLFDEIFKEGSGIDTTNDLVTYLGERTGIMERKYVWKPSMKEKLEKLTKRVIKKIRS